MRVRVRLFAMQREAAGRRELSVELDDGADVEAAWAAAVLLVPALAPGRSSVRFAVNGEYADPTRVRPTNVTIPPSSSVASRAASSDASASPNGASRSSRIRR